MAESEMLHWKWQISIKPPQICDISQDYMFFSDVENVICFFLSRQERLISSSILIWVEQQHQQPLQWKVVPLSALIGVSWHRAHLLSSITATG